MTMRRPAPHGDDDRAARRSRTSWSSIPVEVPQPPFRALHERLPATSAPARRSAWSASPARARRPSAGPSSGSRRSPAATSASTAAIITAFGPRDRRALSRRHPGRLPGPLHSLNPAMTVNDILTEPLLVAGTSKRTRNDACRELLDQVHLPADAGQPLPAGVLRRPTAAGRDRPRAVPRTRD